jgi:hypothetical protein
MTTASVSYTENRTVPVYNVGLREMANIGTRVMDAREVTESLT